MSRLRNLLFGKQNSITDLRGQSYDSAIALDAPVKGSYPVAGNGPSVLDEIQRTRAKRQSLVAATRGSTATKASRPPPEPARPSTAPHHEERNDSSGSGTRSKNGRTMSGFSMKSPPSFFSSRRSSVNSKRETTRIPSEALPPLPTIIVPHQTYIPTYQPSTGSASPSIKHGFAPPSAPFAQQQHTRNASVASHRSHVDLLDAHSTINRTREASRHRTTASGVRNYGEDVADRNIADFGGKKGQKSDSRLDLNLNSPEFSYLKQVYSPKKRPSTRAGGEPHSRLSSALGHVLGAEGDEAPSPSYSRASSIRSFTAPRPSHVYPPRKDSMHSNRAGRTINGVDDRSAGSNLDRRARALSPSTNSIREETYTGDAFPQTTSTPPIPERVRPRAISIKSTDASRHATPIPVPSNPAKSNYRIENNNSPGATHSKQRQRNMSTASDKTIRPPAGNGGTSSRKGSVSYSVFPPVSRRESLASESNESLNRLHLRKDSSKRGVPAVEAASKPPSPEGIVDLKDSVDPDVTARTLPAVAHKHISPIRQEIAQEAITHNIYDRFHPVTDSEVLPPKQYTFARDGRSLIEVTNRTATRPNPPNWPVAPEQSQTSYRLDSGNRSSTDSAPDGPVIGLARGDPKPSTSSSRHHRGESTRSAKSTKSSRSAKDILQPILHPKRERDRSASRDRVEYLWRAPVPSSSNPDAPTQRVMPAFESGGAALASASWYSDEDSDRPGAEFGAEKREGEFLFRDSGYGSGGMVLPGLPVQNLRGPGPGPGAGLGRVVERGEVGEGFYEGEHEGDGELREMKEGRRGGGNIRGVEDGGRGVGYR